MSFLAWFDSNPKKSAATKIAEAQRRYIEKFGQPPLVCLVNPADAGAAAEVELRPLAHIGKGCYWIGVDDTEG